jgi:HPt (histidine-containing phosphotransfer) domain-containing protein
MPKAMEDGDTPSPHQVDAMDAGADAPEAEMEHGGPPDGRGARQPATGASIGTGHPLVLVLDARPAVRDALAGQVILLLPGARPHAGCPAADAAMGHAGGDAAPASRLVVRLAGTDIPVPHGWGDAPVAEVRPRDADGDGVSVGRGDAPGRPETTGRVDLADVALALARCGQLHRVAETGLPPGCRLSGAAMAAGVPEMLRPLLPGVRRTAEVLAVQADEALRSGDLVLLARVGHTLCGMAANYAMPEYAACAATLERAAQTGETGTAADALAWLRAAVAALATVADPAGTDPAGTDSADRGRG